MDKTKKSLVSSTLALIMCIAMLIATTFAWFTDSVASGKNTIRAGNLDIELEYLNAEGQWNSVTEGTKLFEDENVLWEPGHTRVAYLRLYNKGSLALKYNLSINVENEVEGTNVAGETFKLSDYIKMGVVDSWSGTPYANRADARNAVTSAESIKTFTKSGNMQVNASADNPEYVKLAVVAFMPEEVGNVANYKTGTKAPSIDLGVNVVATQLMNERDAFDNTYDAEAPWTGEVASSVPYDDSSKTYTVSNGAELAKIAAIVNDGDDLNGKFIELAKDIDLNGVTWTPIGSKKAFNGTFDGKNHTILNLKVSGDTNVGLFGGLFNYGTIQNVNVKKANVTGVAYVGVIAGGVYGQILNCKVENATVTAKAARSGSKLVDGAKAGSIAGFLREGSSMKLTGCAVKDVTINGYRDLGGIVGCIYGNNTVTSNTCESVTIKQSNLTGYDDGTTTTLGAIFGRNITEGYTGGEIQNNTSGGVNIIPWPAN